MLELDLEKPETFDETTGRFLPALSRTRIELEHSLVSLSKWEAKYKRPFLTDGPSSNDEVLDYIRMMVVGDVLDNLNDYITPEVSKVVADYIADSQTATTITETSGETNRSVITSELVYYWMTAFNIPSEYDRWHFNRLLTLIKICSIKSQPNKKMAQREIMSRQAALNKARLMGGKLKG